MRLASVGQSTVAPLRTKHLPPLRTKYLAPLRTKLPTSSTYKKKSTLPLYVQHTFVLSENTPTNPTKESPPYSGGSPALPSAVNTGNRRGVRLASVGQSTVAPLRKTHLPPLRTKHLAPLRTKYLPPQRTKYLAPCPSTYKAPSSSAYKVPSPSTYKVPCPSTYNTPSSSTYKSMHTIPIL